MKSLHGWSSHRFCFAILLLGTLPLLACDQSSSVGKIGDAGAAGGSTAGIDGGFVSAGGSTVSGAAGSAQGGTTALASAGASAGAGQGGGKTTGQAGASGGKAGALAGGSAVDAGFSTASGTSAVGGAGGARADAAVDRHVCPPLTDVYCSRYTTDAYGCEVCAFSGTGGGSGGVTSKGGTGGTDGGGGTSGAAGSSGTGKACRRLPEQQDAICRSLNYPPLAYFCEVPARPTSSACKAYNAIDSGDAYCCPEQYLACPDSPPTNGTACTGSTACTYGSHPDPTCRTSASCTNSTWRVFAPPARCSEALLPATCPTSPMAATACASHGLSCAYADGTYCICSNCTVEDNLCNASTADTWRCWSPPGGDCPTYYPNLGTTCSVPANTSCRYTCASFTTCTTAGVWAAGPNRCPN